MLQMRASTRLFWCGVIIIASALYGLLIVRDPEFASAIATGYVAALLTIFIIVHVWKKP